MNKANPGHDGAKTMALRFLRRASFGLFRLNLSKSGVSASIGPRGIGITMPLLNWAGRQNNPRVHVGLPGTGLSYNQALKSRKAEQPKSQLLPNPSGHIIERGILGTPVRSK
jgi:hypothetical protein